MNKTNRTREQRRRFRRTAYRMSLTLLFAVVLALVLGAVRYGAYVQDKIRLSAPGWVTAEAVCLPEDFDAAALARASDRYEWERDPVLYAALLRPEGADDGRS